MIEVMDVHILQNPNGECRLRIELPDPEQLPASDPPEDEAIALVAGILNNPAKAMRKTLAARRKWRAGVSGWSWWKCLQMRWKSLWLPTCRQCGGVGEPEPEPAAAVRLLYNDKSRKKGWPCNGCGKWVDSIG